MWAMEGERAVIKVDSVRCQTDGLGLASVQGNSPRQSVSQLSPYQRFLSIATTQAYLPLGQILDTGLIAIHDEARSCNFLNLLVALHVN